MIRRRWSRPGRVARRRRRGAVLLVLALAVVGMAAAGPAPAQTGVYVGITPPSLGPVLAPTPGLLPAPAAEASAPPVTNPLVVATDRPPAQIGPRGPTLTAVAPDHQPRGPAGVGLQVTGSGYGLCHDAYVFFDSVRIGTDRPDPSGLVALDRLSVPGDSRPGQHMVTLACGASGRPALGSAVFLVTDARVHRGALATSLAGPDQISLDLARIVASGVAALAILLLFAFPYQLFNSTVQENYDEMRGWLRLPKRAMDAVSNASRDLTFLGLTVLTAITLGFLDPKFGLSINSAVIVAGFTVGLILMSVAFGLPGDIGIHRRTGEWGKLNFLPGTLLVSMVLVLLSRLMHFQPGYFYGALAGLAFACTVPAKSQGRLTAANWVWALGLSMGAWFLRLPVSEAASQPDASSWWIGAEACLVLMFLWGIESLAVAMLPMRFLDGRKVIDWNRTVWAVLMFVGVFASVHVLLAPNSGYVGHTTGQVAIGVLALFFVFGALSVGLWAYFRYRPARWAPAPTGTYETFGSR